jgi:hypothetical protein
MAENVQRSAETGVVYVYCTSAVMCESLDEVKTCRALSEAHNRASGSRNVVEQIKIWRENPVWKKILQIGPCSFLCVSVEDGATLIGECVVVVVQEASLAWVKQTLGS